MLVSCIDNYNQNEWCPFFLITEHPKSGGLRVFHPWDVILASLCRGMELAPSFEALPGGVVPFAFREGERLPPSRLKGYAALNLYRKQAQPLVQIILNQRIHSSIRLVFRDEGDETQRWGSGINYRHDVGDYGGEYTFSPRGIVEAAPFVRASECYIWKQQGDLQYCLIVSGGIAHWFKVQSTADIFFSLLILAWDNKNVEGMTTIAPRFVGYDCFPGSSVPTRQEWVTNHFGWFLQTRQARLTFKRNTECVNQLSSRWKGFLED